MAGSTFSPLLGRDSRHAHQGRTAIVGKSQEGHIRDAGHLYCNYITLEFHFDSALKMLENAVSCFDILKGELGFHTPV